MNSGMLWCLTPRIALTGVSIGFSSTQHCINHVPVQLGMMRLKIWTKWWVKKIQQFFKVLLISPEHSSQHTENFPKLGHSPGNISTENWSSFFSNLKQVMLHDISVVINKRWPTSWRVLLTGPPKYIVPHPEDHYWFWVSNANFEGSFQILFGKFSP